LYFIKTFEIATLLRIVLFITE